MRSTRVWAALRGFAFLGVCLAYRQGAGGGQTLPPAPIVLEGKLDTSTGQLLIPVRLDEARLWCSLDSGFSATIAVDRARAALAGLTAAQAPSAADTTAKAILNVGDVSMGERSIIIRRLPAEAPEMECIMGVAVLRRFVVEMDFAAARVRLHERDGYRAPATAREVPLIFRTNLNVPFVQVALTFADGTRRMAQVVPDTGTSYYAGVLVPTFVASVLAQIPRIASPPQRPDSSRPNLRFKAGRLAAISVGSFTMREPVVALIETGLDGGGIDDGTLGTGFFRRFTVTFDLEGRVMYLQPNQHFTERQSFDASGAAFRRAADGYQVDVVLPDSPASRAGLSEGDRLLDVDSRAPQTFTPVQLRDYLSRSGETCALRVLRNGAVLRLTLRLENRL